MNKRKIVAIVLSISIFLGGYSNTYATEIANTTEDLTDTQTTSEVKDTDSNIMEAQLKAEVLNKLNIISGDGKGNYSLDSQLKRSEAATFIVKLLGKDNFIKENKEIYKKTGFKDVKSTDWFINYISYCEQNTIISGLGNGKFGPNNFISEKAFLVLVMKSLGYTSEAGDFSWDTVFSDAYRLGLVKDSDYEQITEDNNEYKRSDVVEVLYNSLALKLKDSNLTLLQSLTNEGVIDRVTAASTGLLTDSIIAGISTVSPQNESRVAITFNEELYPISLENIKIYSSAKKSLTLTVTKIISQSQGKIVLATEKQTADKEYTIEFLNMKDLEGNADKKLSTTFKGYKVSEIKSDFFKISRVENISQNEIKVYFTHPVNENIEVPSYYQIYENDQLFVEGSASTLQVDALEGDGNAVSLQLYNVVLNPEKEYKVKVSGNIFSVYGTKLNSGSGDEATFIPIQLEAREFKVDGIYSISKNTVQIDFNEAVNPVLAKQVYNYNITDASNIPLQITQAAVIGAEGKSVSLTINGILMKTNIYNVMINRITDLDKKEEIIEKTYNFSGDYPDNVDLYITNVTVSDLEMITVEFNKDIDEESAMKKDNYTVAELSGVYRSFAPDSIYFSKLNPRQVKLYFKATNGLKNLSSYKVRVNPLFKDYSGVNINRVLEYGFVTVGIANAQLSISRAAIISNDTIIVKFSGEEIAFDYPNSYSQNYSLTYLVNGESYKKIPLAVTYIDMQTVVLKFDALDFSQAYTIKCNEIKKYAGDVVKADDLKTGVTMGQE